MMMYSNLSVILIYLVRIALDDSFFFRIEALLQHPHLGSLRSQRQLHLKHNFMITFFISSFNLIAIVQLRSQPD